MAWRILVFSSALAMLSGCSSRDGGRSVFDAGSDGAAGFDGGRTDGATRSDGGGLDSGPGQDGGGRDGGGTSDGGTSDGGGTDAPIGPDGCIPPPCPAPPPGCHYEGFTPCTCGTLVCDDSCGGFTGAPCALDEYCDYPAGMPCGIADGTGTCQPRPFACPDVYIPVCGCDLVTYGNDCEAYAAGTDVATSGECPPPPPPPPPPP